MNYQETPVCFPGWTREAINETAFGINPGIPGAVVLRNFVTQHGLAAERRKSLATADRPWLRFKQESGAAVAAKESFAATAAPLLLVFEIHGLSAVAKLLRRSAAKTGMLEFAARIRATAPHSHLTKLLGQLVV